MTHEQVTPHIAMSIRWGNIEVVFFSVLERLTTQSTNQRILTRTGVYGSFKSVRNGDTSLFVSAFRELILAAYSSLADGPSRSKTASHYLAQANTGLLVQDLQTGSKIYPLVTL